MLGGVSNGHKTDQERNRLSIVHSQQILDEFIGLELFQAFNISEHLVCARSWADGAKDMPRLSRH